MLLHFHNFLTFLCVEVKGNEALSRQLRHIHPILPNTNMIALPLMGTYLLEECQSPYLAIFKMPHPGGILAPRLHLQYIPNPFPSPMLQQ